MLHLFLLHKVTCFFVGFYTEKRKFIFNQGRSISRKFNSVLDKKKLCWVNET
jgi:hypothetical protein